MSGLAHTSAVQARGVSVLMAARHVIERLDFAASFGELVGVIGPNGAGKSTLLRVLASLLRPHAGVVVVDGADVRMQSRRDLACSVAVVPQSTSIDFSFPVRDVVLMGRHPHIRRFTVESADDHAIAHRAMVEAGVRRLADRDMATLSGGERQLVLIAKALAQEPRVLLLDEPVAALDIRHQLAILELIRGHVDSGLCAVAVLHDLNLAARFCDRLALLTEGHVVAVGTPREVLTEALLRRAYRVRTNIGIDPATGSVFVTPLSRTEL
jgi:iron complex transport system ATP-binding protein